MGLATLDVNRNTKIGNTQKHDTCYKYKNVNEGIAVAFGGLCF